MKLSPSNTSENISGGLRHALLLFASALWWGSLVGLCFIAVPLLFAHLPSHFTAGNIGAKIFTAQSWVALTCGAILLLGAPRRTEDYRSYILSASVITGMLLAVIIEYVIAPHILARDHLKFWHSFSVALYVLEFLDTGIALWLIGSPNRLMRETFSS